MIQASTLSVLIIVTSAQVSHTTSSSAILLTGGTQNEETDLSSVEVYPSSVGCSPLPPLSTKRVTPYTFTHEGEILICGGANDGWDQTDICERLDLGTNSWVHHSQLTTKGRWYSSFVVSDGLPCIIGGDSYPDNDAITMECLKDNTWTLTPDSMPGEGLGGGCAAPTPGGGILVIGGWNAETQVLERLSSGTWDTTSWPQLSRGRTAHSCSTYDSNTKVMVTGGKVDGDPHEHASSTLIFDLPTKTITAGPDFHQNRAFHATVTWGDKLYILGGAWRFDDSVPLSSVEVYEGGVWTELEETLTEERAVMGYTLVPLASIGC